MKTLLLFYSKGLKYKYKFFIFIKNKTATRIATVQCSKMMFKNVAFERKCLVIKVVFLATNQEVLGSNPYGRTNFLNSFTEDGPP